MQQSLDGANAAAGAESGGSGGLATSHTMGRMTDDRAVSKVIATKTPVRLDYTIHEYSSYCGTFHPHNIRVNKPSDQSSRWSSGTHDQTQYLVLRLDQPAVACSIMFGKFHRAHVCNLREFKVYGGMDPDDMVEILHNGLQNNPEAEIFPLVHSLRNVVFPIQYIKIVPLATYGPNFNYSIWHVDLRGHCDPKIMELVMHEYQNYRERETLRLCLKHFRQRNMMDIFYMIKNRTGVELEHPFLSDLHKYLVLESDFDAAERVLEEAHACNVFNEYINNAEYKPEWKRIWSTTEDGDAPCGRGGHQMCIDTEEEKIYLFGGWNGHHDLADLWCYHIREGQWRLISVNTELQGGPSPRSCHKICFDPDTKSIFVLGRFIESSVAMTTNLESDFYRYFVEYDQWVKISDNTGREGGPGLLYDHQMCIDTMSSELFVFGGRLFAEANGYNYGPLYSYHIPTNTWQMIRFMDDDQPLTSRVGHSMLFDPTCRSLYIFAGQRVKDYLTDLLRYQIDEDRLTDIGSEYAKSFGPKAGFTQRAIMESTKQEIHVLTGYKHRQASEMIANELWIYNIQHNQWKCVYQSKNQRDTQRDDEYPTPRYAHEMVYNPSIKTHYIFGGNPGDPGAAYNNGSNRRLADFWELRLTKPDPASIFRHCLLMIRMQRMRELCRRANSKRNGTEAANDATLKALEYLQSKVATIVDHSIREEASQFQQLCAELCLSSEITDQEQTTTKRSFADDDDTESFEERTHLFESILQYLPAQMKEPSGQLLDAVNLV
ncbi:hypothetical protein K492DRAFT_142763 [Lichtheimia hyalospora FSU 10163]|nr:hypothetical protein K492DRAFT_142763 [Lichtheimia hyalospora FSU 10163]